MVEVRGEIVADPLNCLGDEPSAKYLDLVDDENLPQYSDVVLILSQYVAAMKSYHGKYHRFHMGMTQWVYAD